MGMVVGMIGLAALAVSFVVTPIAIFLYVLYSRVFERGNWIVWSGLAILSGIMTVMIAFYQYHQLSQLPNQQGGMTGEIFQAIIVFVGLLGLTPGIAALSGLLALALPKKRTKVVKSQS